MGSRQDGALALLFGAVKEGENISWATKSHKARRHAKKYVNVLRDVVFNSLDATPEGWRDI